MDPVPTQLKDLKVGGIIYAPVLIAVDDLVDPMSNSHTARENGKRINRLAIVLEKPKEDAIIVTFLETFAPQNEDFYPPVELFYVDKDKIVPQWASLRKKQLIDSEVLRKEAEEKEKRRLPPDAIFEVKKILDKTASPDTVNTILGKMKA